MAVNSSYFFTICLVKVTILMLYLRIFTESKRFRYTIYVVLATLVTTHMATFPVYYSDLTPFHCHWTIYPTEDERYSRCSEKYDALPWIVFIVVLTIVLDIVILTLPCPAVWRLHMARRQKIAILLLLTAGVLYEEPPSPLTFLVIYTYKPETGKKANIQLWPVCCSVTIASILRLAYMLRRFYFDSHFTNSLYTEFQVNTIR